MTDALPQPVLEAQEVLATSDSLKIFSEPLQHVAINQLLAYLEQYPRHSQDAQTAARIIVDNLGGTLQALYAYGREHNKKYDLMGRLLPALADRGQAEAVAQLFIEDIKTLWSVGDRGQVDIATGLVDKLLANDQAAIVAQSFIDDIHTLWTSNDTRKIARADNLISQLIENGQGDIIQEHLYATALEFSLGTRNTVEGAKRPGLVGHGDYLIQRLGLPVTLDLITLPSDGEEWSAESWVAKRILGRFFAIDRDEYTGISPNVDRVFDEALAWSGDPRANVLLEILSAYGFESVSRSDYGDFLMSRTKNDYEELFFRREGQTFSNVTHVFQDWKAISRAAATPATSDRRIGGTLARVVGAENVEPSGYVKATLQLVRDAKQETLGDDYMQKRFGPILDAALREADRSKLSLALPLQAAAVA
jgi:multidrug efflux pump subunit AcrA (membrane-fusion protein)